MSGGPPATVGTLPGFRSTVGRTGDADPQVLGADFVPVGSEFNCYPLSEAVFVLKSLKVSPQPRISSLQTHKLGKLL